MTIRELMDRIAGDEYTWEGVDRTMEADTQVQMAILSGISQDGRPLIYRLPVERLKKKI